MGKKLKRMGDIMFLVEKFVSKAAGEHDLQRHEILALVDRHIMFHYPNANEEFNDGTRPFVYFGHQDGVEDALEIARAVDRHRRKRRRSR
jgi:hypothetical protein